MLESTLGMMEDSLAENAQHDYEKIEALQKKLERAEGLLGGDLST